MDSSLSPRHSLQTASAGGVVVSVSGRIVVVGQITRSDSLPKGHVELGETLLEAARREIVEETGIHVGDPLIQFPAYVRNSGRRAEEVKHIVMFLFALDDEPALKPLDPFNSNARWLEFAHALDTLTYSEDRDFLRSVAENVAAVNAGRKSRLAGRSHRESAGA